MFNGYRAPHREGRQRDVASKGVKDLDITLPHLRPRVSAALSSLMPRAQTEGHAHRLVALAGPARQRRHRDPSPTRPRQTELLEGIRSNGSSTPERPRFS